MPWLVCISGDLVHFLGKAKDEAVVGKLLMNLRGKLFFSDHVFVIVNDNAVFNGTDIDHKAGMILGVTGDGDVLFTARLAVLPLVSPVGSIGSSELAIHRCMMRVTRISESEMVIMSPRFYPHRPGNHSIIPLC